MQPFAYMIADNSGKPVWEEICCSDSPIELEDYYQTDIEDNGHKVVPVYSGPEIELMRELLQGVLDTLDLVRREMPPINAGVICGAFIIDEARIKKALLPQPSAGSNCSTAGANASDHGAAPTNSMGKPEADIRGSGVSPCSAADHIPDFGCKFPGKCCMPGDHFESECHTAEDMDSLNQEIK